MQVLNEIRYYLKELSQKEKETVNNRSNFQDAVVTQDSHRDLVAAEWYRLGLILDRITVIVYLVISLLVTIAMLSH